MEIDEPTRYGLTWRTLELEAGELSVVLGKRTLGADPRDVAPLPASVLNPASDILPETHATHPSRLTRQ